MELVSSTGLALALAIAVTLQGPRFGVVAFFAVIPFGMMAAANLPALGHISVMTYDLVLVALVLTLVSRAGLIPQIGHLLGPGQVAVPLVLFCTYALFATAYFPRLFAGQTDVFAIGRVAGQTGIVSRPLQPLGGNLSQSMRILLGFASFATVALIIARTKDAGLALRAMIAVSIGHIALGFADLITQATNTAWLLEPFRSANYALTLGQRLSGLNRLIGGFPEASSYGYVTLGLFGFWAGYWFHNTRRAPWALVMAGVFAALLIRGTSSSAYVGAALLVAVFATLRLAEAARAGPNSMAPRVAGSLVLMLAVLPVTIAGAYAAYATAPGVADFLDRALLTKLSSHSGIERMSWNRQALVNAYDTGFLGAGLGSVRASNWIAATLGTTGLLGLALLCAFLWRLFRLPVAHLPASEHALAFGLKLGLAGCLCRALVVKATPNLDFIFFAMAGLLVGLTLKARAPVRRIQRNPQWQV